jgi:GntR family transcriptional regulator
MFHLANTAKFDMCHHTPPYLVIRVMQYAGDPLPSIRQLASQLIASVITTKRAYSELEAEGLIVTRAGLGTFVADLDPKTIMGLKKEVVMEHLEEGVRVARQLELVDEEINRLFRQALDGSEKRV